MRLYWVWLATRQGMSSAEKYAALARFETPENCYYADAEAISQVEGLRETAAAALRDKSLEQAEAIVSACRRKKVGILAFGDPEYPASLKNIADPPLVLYYKGSLPEFDSNPMIGVVGTRKASPYGLRAAEQLGRELAGHGGIVVSGLADGVDAKAMAGALEAQGTVVGVLGCGIDRVYPSCNRELFQKTEQQGCILSEYAPGVPPERWYFPQRNRIISGIACGVLVVEAPQKSGALITARQAMEQGRDVFAVPGNIGVETCMGSNELLRDGAIAVTCGWDVLSEYTGRYPHRITREIQLPQRLVDKKAVDIDSQPPYSDLEHTAAPLPADLTDDERTVLAALGSEEQLIDDMIAGMELTRGDVLAALTMLEVKGYVNTRPGGWVSASKFH